MSDAYCFFCMIVFFFFFKQKPAYEMRISDWSSDVCSSDRGLLTPPSAEAARSDIEFLKKAGFNMLRKHIKVEPAQYYADADRLGILIWQDMPSGAFGDQAVRRSSTQEATMSSAALDRTSVG